jgi:5-methylcytosine-specific restriction enzyme subunit McrC
MENCLVLDTKWKNLNGYNPSPDDLRQMYVYHEFYKAKRVALLYPGSESSEIKGCFFPTPDYLGMDKICSVILLAVPSKAKADQSLVRTWQEDIQQNLEKWIG